nr:MAG TPA: endonuclease-like protein [Caudoviricetes sp.]
MSNCKSFKEDQRKDILEYLLTHSKDATARHFHVSAKRLNILIESAVDYKRPSREDLVRITKEERYGDPNYNNIEKNKATKEERYNNSNYNNSKKSKSKKPQKSYYIPRGRYDENGVYKNNVTKRRETCLKKYGTPSASGNFLVRKRIEQTCLEKYGVSNASKNSEIIKKIRDTHFQKYGGIGWATAEGRKHYNEIMEEKYGVEWFCQHEKCIAANKCGKDSSHNILFKNLLLKYNISYEEEYVIDNYRYDFRVNNYLIELNPSATHNVDYSPYGNHRGISLDYHRDKILKARKKGFHCILVWDWDNPEKIISLLLPRESIYARKCEIKEVDVEEEIPYLNKYHLQGYIKSNIRIGLYYNKELVSLMTFGDPRYNKNYQYELLRYCSSKKVLGGAEKIFKYFINNYFPNSIISYCDESKFIGNVYNKLGFKLLRISIGTHWAHLYKKIHITDNLLRQRGFDQLLGKEFGMYGKNTSNEELMLQNHFVRIKDAGQSTYIWKK